MEFMRVDTCAICMEDVPWFYPMVSRCGHQLHVSCLKQWKCQLHGYRCPTCRCVNVDLLLKRLIVMYCRKKWTICHVLLDDLKMADLVLYEKLDNLDQAIVPLCMRVCRNSMDPVARLKKFLNES